MAKSSKSVIGISRRSVVNPASEDLPTRAKTPRNRSNVIEPSAGLMPVHLARNFSVSHAGIAKSLRFISSNYFHPFQVQDLGEIAGLSRRGYIKAFQKHVGARPAQFLRHLRMEHAKRLLIKGDLPLKEIAAQCGYRSVNSFWVAFRQTTGMGPGKFQHQARLTNRLLQRAAGATPSMPWPRNNWRTSPTTASPPPRR